jgi:crossover junction endodeoxyribonuclease RuvC
VKRVLTLDMGSNCGWALRDRTGVITTGVTKFLKSITPGSRWLRFHAWLNSWDDLQLIVYEEPFIHFKHRSGLGVSYGFKTILELYVAQKEIRCVGIAPRLLKQFATGHGNASKDQMWKFANSMNWGITDDNEIDARFLMLYATERLLKLKEVA